VPSQLTYAAIERRVGAGVAIAATVAARVMIWVVRRHHRARALSEG
jgi:hypothetical protein